MATGSTNNKSQQLNARFPHDVVADLEKTLKMERQKHNSLSRQLKARSNADSVRRLNPL